MYTFSLSRTSGGFAEASGYRFFFAAKPRVAVGLIDNYLVIVIAGREVIDFFTIPRITLDDAVTYGTCSSTILGPDAEFT